MKIVQINSSYGYADSTGRNVKEFHEWLIKKGLESYVFTTKLNDNTDSYSECVIKFSNFLEEKIHALLSRLTGLQGYFSIISTLKLVNKIRKINPDAILIHVLHSNCVNFKMLFHFFEKNNIKVILVLHDCFFFTGHCCYYTYVNCQRWQKECGYCPTLREYNKSLIFDTSRKLLKDKHNYFDKIKKLKIIGVSDWISSEAKKSILKEKDITTIYNWVDLQTFYPRESLHYVKRSKKKIVLAIASKWTESKGLYEIRLIAKRNPDITVVLIGYIDNKIILEQNILCVGVIKNPEELAEYYSIAEVFANPSKQETFGKTTAESLACGTPVVAYSTTACKELVGDGRGKLVELDDMEAFNNAVMLMVLEGKDAYSKECVQFARDNFSGEINMNKYLDYIIS